MIHHRETSAWPQRTTTTRAGLGRIPSIPASCIIDATTNGDKAVGLPVGGVIDLLLLRGHDEDDDVSTVTGAVPSPKRMHCLPINDPTSRPPMDPFLGIDDAG